MASVQDISKTVKALTQAGTSQATVTHAWTDPTP